MRRLPAFAMVLLVVSIGRSPIRADPFGIDVEVEAAKLTRTAHAETVSVDVKSQRRGILTIKAGDPITVKWTLTNNGQGAAKDILVHFFVVKEEKPDQQAVPELTKGVAAESAFTMDFEPKDKAEGDLTFAIGKAGSYLLRLETKGAAGKDSPKYFAAIDLMVR